jgi:hypothetical protein
MFITNLIVLVLGVATVLGMLGMGINSIRLLRSLRAGVLEKGWKYISIAAFCLIYGILALDLSVASIFQSALLIGILGYSGAAFQAIGGITMAYGIKSEYDAWNPKGMKKPANTALAATK